MLPPVTAEGAAGAPSIVPRSVNPSAGTIPTTWPMARVAQGPAAQKHGARLSDLVELRRHARSHPPRALCRVPRARRTRSESNRCHHRQPEREERRKRGPCIDPPGYDAGKKIKGKKRHVLVDTLGLLLHAIVHPADIQDRDGGVLLLATLFGMYPFLQTLFADAGYQGHQFHELCGKLGDDGMS
jgi:hypothetical protein